MHHLKQPILPLQLQLLLVAAYFIKISDAATIGIFSTSTCSGNPSQTYVVFNDLCTARYGTAITVASCSDSNIRVVTYDDSATEKVKAPKCGTGTGTYFDASTSCSKVTSTQYSKILDGTCKAPSNIFIASLDTVACSSPYIFQLYTSIIADGTCRFNRDSSYYYKASQGSGSNTIDFKVYNTSSCSFNPESEWNGARTTGECLDTNVKDLYKSLQITTPATFALSSSIIASAVGSIVGGVIGTIIWCFGCWGILHACGCVNCPCFNRCCDRRKNIASSGSSPSYPSASPYGAQMATPYGAQAPRSNPYGNVRHV
jgi:hypothetical protein